METREIRIEEIDVGDRLRATDPDKVAEFMSSYLEHGLLVPIEVRRNESARYDLVYGAHRLAAVQRAGHETIKAQIFTGSAKEARLREIDENLYRHELTPYDQAAFLAERRSLYEELNGAIKAGRKGQKNRSNLHLVPVQLSFLDETTQKFGLPKDTIKRALSRRLRFDNEAWQLLRGTPFVRKGVDLDAISRLPPEKQRQVVKRLTTATHPAKTVRAAIKAVMGSPAPAAEKTIAQRVITLLRKASPRDREQVLAYLQETSSDEG